MNKRIKTLQTQLNAHLKKESVDNTLKDRDFPTFGSTTCPFLAVKKKKNDHVHGSHRFVFLLFFFRPISLPHEQCQPMWPRSPRGYPDLRPPAAANAMPTPVGSHQRHANSGRKL
jgi:hypothetical protein